MKQRPWKRNCYDEDDRAGPSKRFKPSEMKSKRKDEPTPTPYTILEVPNVAAEVSLFDVLMEISQHITSIVGIARAADYRNKIGSTTIYLYCVNRDHAEYLEHCTLKYNEEETQATIIDAYVGRAEFSNDGEVTTMIRRAPATLYLRQLPTVKYNFAIYLVAELARYFSYFGTVTAVRTSIDTHRDRTQGLGFATFLRGVSAITMDGGFHKLCQQEFTSGLSRNVPLLLSKEHAAMIIRGATIWTERVERFNLLTLDLSSLDTIPEQMQPDDNEQRDGSVLELEDNIGLDDLIN